MEHVRRRTTTISRLRWIACLMAAIGAVALPAAALAADSGRAGTDPTTSQYSNSLTGAENSAGGKDNATDPGSGGVAGESGSSSGAAIGGLPFTGTDLVALAAVAICLLSTGLVFQRLAARSR